MPKHENVNAELDEKEIRVTNLSEAEVSSICDSCKEFFSNAGDFIYHMANNHKEAAVTFFDWKLDLKLHQSVA